MADFEDFVGTRQMNMDVVKAKIKPWVDKSGFERYYVSVSVLSDYRDATDYNAHSYYDWDDMCASPGRVVECIERNIIPKTKVYIDGNGFVHVYGYAIGPKGRQLGLPEEFETACRYFYGLATEEERDSRRGDIGKSGMSAKVGDIVEIVKGRKQVGYVFEVARAYTYYPSHYYSHPTTYLIDRNGFKVNAENCVVADVGYAL